MFRHLAAASALLLALAGSPPVLTAQQGGPQQFTLLIYESPADLAERRDAQHAAGYWGRYTAFAMAMQQAGVLRGGTALATGATVRTVGSASTERSLRTPEPSGYFIIEVGSIDEAEEWARSAPSLRHGVVEVRAHLPNPGMKP